MGDDGADDDEIFRAKTLAKAKVSVPSPSEAPYAEIRCRSASKIP